MDSLLQVHALYNLLLIDTTLNEEDRKLYECDLNRFEMKYLEKNVQLVANFHTNRRRWTETIADIESEFIQNAYQWWIDTLTNERYSGSNNLLQKIQEEVINHYSFMDQRLARIPFFTLICIPLI